MCFMSKSVDMLIHPILFIYAEDSSLRSVRQHSIGPHTEELSFGGGAH